jgi:hypothetical protein
MSRNVIIIIVIVIAVVVLLCCCCGVLGLFSALGLFSVPWDTTIEELGAYGVPASMAQLVSASLVTATVV